MGIGLGAAGMVLIEPEPEALRQPHRGKKVEKAVTKKKAERIQPVISGDSLKSILDQMPKEKFVSAGDIWGKVIDTEGHPVAGVTIKAYMSDKKYKSMKEMTVEEAVARTMKAYRRAQSGKLETMTDASGHYRLKDLADARYSLSGKKKGLSIAVENRQRSWNLKPGSELNFTASKVYQITAEVLMPDGKRAQEATIESSQGSGSSSRSWSSDNKDVNLDPGTHMVRAVHEDGFASAKQSITLGPENNHMHVTFKLEARSGIKGKVVYPKGMFAGSDQHLVVGYKRHKGEGAPNLSNLVAVEDKWLTGGENKFSFLDVKPGKYVVWVKSGWRGEAEAHVVITVVDGKMSEITLTNHNGKPFDGKMLKGKAWVAGFMFTRCAGTCPKMMARLLEIQKAQPTGPDFALATFTLDPDHDTPAVLAKFRDRYAITDPHWYFLTGPLKEISTLCTKHFLLAGGHANHEGHAHSHEEGHKDQPKIIHSDRFALVDREGKIRGVYKGLEEEGFKRLMKELKELLALQP